MTAAKGDKIDRASILNNSFNKLNELLIKAKKKEKIFVYILSATPLLFFLFYRIRFWRENEEYLFFLFGSFVLFLGYNWIAIGQSIAKYQDEIIQIESKHQYLDYFDSNEKSYSQQDYFNKLVEINVENLGSYYALVKIHANKGFNTSLYSGLIGFSFIIISIFLGSFYPERISITYIAAAAGIITEFISGIFFFLYMKTVRQLKEYHDSLLNVQNVLLSFKIISDVKSETVRSQLTSEMLKALLQKSN